MTPDPGSVRGTAHLRELWEQDLPAFGLWNGLADASVAELLGATAFDYVCVDLQHGIATFSELPTMLQAMRGAAREPVVRVPWNEPVSIMRALDTGAGGVIVPMVNSANEAERAARACRYPPIGERSWGSIWGNIRASGAARPEEQDAAVMCIVMVETRSAVDSLEEILAVPGVDGVYIGPSDLALDFGYGRATYRNSADIDQLIQSIIDRCRGAEMVAGLHCSDTEMANHWAGRGARMLTAGQDIALLDNAAASAWASLHESRAR